MPWWLQIIVGWVGASLVVTGLFVLVAEACRRRGERRRRRRRGGFVTVAPSGSFTDQDRRFCERHGVAL